MKLIVGLGNPGPKYRQTRHNVGFWAVETIADEYDIGLQQKSATALWGRGRIGTHDVILAEPLLYMNRSGEAVSALIRQHRSSPEHLMVIHDDFELDPGRIRIKTRGGHGGHNGLRSILEILGTGDFVRVKIGIGHPAGQDPSDYVLGRLNSEERDRILERAGDIARVLPLMIEGHLDLARNRLAHELKRSDA